MTSKQSKRKDPAENDPRVRSAIEYRDLVNAELQAARAKVSELEDLYDAAEEALRSAVIAADSALPLAESASTVTWTGRTIIDTVVIVARTKSQITTRDVGKLEGRQRTWRMRDGAWRPYPSAGPYSGCGSDVLHIPDPDKKSD